MNKRETARRAQWLAQYELILVAEIPALAGKVDWDTAIFFYNRGDTASHAAAIMIQRWSDHDTNPQEDTRS